MKAEKGLVVRAIAGRDSGGWFVIVDCDDDYFWIADGKTRKLSSPKKKNKKHVRFTKQKIDLSQATDKKLRVALKQFTDKNT